MNTKAFISLSVAIFVTMIGFGIVAPLIPLYATDLGASGLLLGFMYSAFALSRALFMTVTGWLSDKRGRKNLIIYGMIIYGVSSFLYSITSNIFQLIAVRFLAGMSVSLIVPIAQAYVGDIIPKGKEGYYMNLFLMSMFIGMGVGPLLGGTLNDLFNMNFVFYTTATFSLLALILLIIFVPPMKNRINISRKEPLPLMLMIKDNRIKALGIYMASRGIFRQGIIAFLPLLAVNELGMSTTGIGLVLSIYMIIGALGQGVWGSLADRYNKNWLMMIGSFLAPLLLVFLPGMQSSQTLLFILVPVGLLTALSRAACMAYNVEIGAQYGRMGAAMGVVGNAMAIGQFLGPLLLGWAMDEFGVGSVFYFAAGIGLVASILMTYWLYSRQELAYLKETEATAEPALDQR